MVNVGCQCEMFECVCECECVCLNYSLLKQIALRLYFLLVWTLLLFIFVYFFFFFPFPSLFFVFTFSLIQMVEFIIWMAWQLLVATFSVIFIGRIVWHIFETYNKLHCITIFEKCVCVCVVYSMRWLGSTKKRHFLVIANVI